MLKSNIFSSTSTIEYDTDDDDDDDNSNAEDNFNIFCQNTYNSLISKAQHSNNETRNKSLKEKLIDIYLEENKKNHSTNLLNYSTNLLEKLLKREDYNTLVLNLYSTNNGYSIGFNIKSFNSNNEMNKIETKFLSYDESELLSYINYSEIPPILIDLVDRLNVNLFYDGCIILEVRDHRRKEQQQSFHVHYVLLQPSVQTLLTDLNSITNDGNFIWTQEDKYALESQLILANSQELCLHPSPIVSIIKNKIFTNKFKLNDKRLKRNINRYSHQYMKRSTKWSEFKLPNPYNILKIRKKYSKSSNESAANDSTLKCSNLKSASSSFLITSLFVDNWPKSNAITNMRLPKEDMIFVKRFSNSTKTCHQNFICGK